MSSWVTALNWGQFTIGHATGVAYTITKATIFIYQQPLAAGPARAVAPARLDSAADGVRRDCSGHANRAVGDDRNRRPSDAAPVGQAELSPAADRAVLTPALLDVSLSYDHR